MKTKFSGILTLILAFVVQISFAQEKTISGTVIDESGLPLPGTTVLVKGTSTGTSSDFDGKYSISAKQGDILVFSFVGYTTQEIAVGSSSTVNVTMSEDASALEEVIVVAYGTQKKEEITGSVTTIKTEELNQVQASSIAQGLVGKVSGVQIINQSGQPGEDPSIRFRGIGSINSSSQPLYVVDGVVFNGNINSIATQDIESMTFLKDASANALYGSRGANGVIIVTTKKGKQEGVEITIDSKIGFNRRAVPEYSVIRDPARYYEAWYQSWRTGLIAQGSTPADAAAEASAGLISNGDYSLNYNSFNVANDALIDTATGRINPSASLLYQDDWDDASFSTGIRTENYLSLRTRSDKSNSFFSLGHLKDEGYALKSGFERITGRLSTEYTPNDWLKVGGNVNYAHTSQDSPIQGLGSTTLSNLFYWARSVAPIYPIYARDASGGLILDNAGNRQFDYGDGTFGQRPAFVSNTNPIGTLNLGLDENVVDNISSRVFATVNFLKDFSFTYNFSADITLGNLSQFDTAEGGSAANANGRITTRSNRGITTTNQQLLNWSKDFGDHSFSVLVGHESFDYNFKLLGGEVTETVIGDLPVLDNGVNIQEVIGYRKDYTVEGYLSRLTYDYADKYFVNASFRRDGSSVFHPDNRWGNFYGVGFAWSAHKEDFLSNVDWLSTLRLKASMGQQGNDALLYEDTRTRNPGDRDNRNYIAYQDQFDIVNAGGNTPGVTFFQLGNEDLVWETSTNTNVGFELGLFDNRININAEYFERKVEDLLFYNPVPTSIGVGSKPENIGDMENKGIEVELSADILRGDFYWNFSINATHYKNEITSLPDEFIDDPILVNHRLVEGRSRYDYFMREWAGVDEATGDGQWYIVDPDTGEKTTTNIHSDATEVFVDKSAIPDLYGGFNTSFGYKGFSLNVGFAYQIGGYGYDGVYQGLLSASSPGSNFHTDIFDMWTPENTTASIPRIDTIKSDQNDTSDYFLVDASYLSLNDITLGYDFDKKVTDMLGITSLRLYASANNVELWSKARKGYDPRLSVSGNATNEYSLISTTSFGLTLKF